LRVSSTAVTAAPTSRRTPYGAIGMRIRLRLGPRVGENVG